ncbi:MAG: LLM class flavin-dependent oxidoreductase [Actinomadura sp.]
MGGDFRFGVVGESIRSRADLTRTARRAESLGCDVPVLRGHFVAEPFGDQLAPMVALAAAACATSALRPGTMVLANDYRHPVVPAKEAAALDHLSGGRFGLGVGAGRVAGRRGWGASAADPVLDMPCPRHAVAARGPAGHIAEQLLARRGRYGVTYYQVSDGGHGGVRRRRRAARRPTAERGPGVLVTPGTPFCSGSPGPVCERPHRPSRVRRITWSRRAWASPCPGPCPTPGPPT